MKFHEGMGDMELPEELRAEVRARQKAHWKMPDIASGMPEYYKDFLDTLTPEQRHELIVMQARAMEKVGFEEDTDKFFIDRVKPERYVKPLTVDSSMVLAFARPRLVLGGGLSGAGAAYMTFMALGLAPAGWLIAIPLIALVGGIWLIMNPLGDTPA
jgi:hypothetical protein